MAGRKEGHRADDRAGKRSGLGDDQGTRVGRPDTALPEDRTTPSSQPVSEGLEGSILSGADSAGAQSGAKSGAKSKGSTGSGAEAARGIHEAGSGHGAGRGSEGKNAGGTNVERVGSEPIKERTDEHESGYGGRGGEPRTSSDQRE